MQFNAALVKSLIRLGHLRRNKGTQRYQKLTKHSSKFLKMVSGGVLQTKIFHSVIYSIRTFMLIASASYVLKFGFVMYLKVGVTRIAKSGTMLYGLFFFLYEKWSFFLSLWFKYLKNQILCICTCTSPMTTKHGKVVIYKEGLPPINSHNLLSIRAHSTTLQIENISPISRL